MSPKGLLAGCATAALLATPAFAQDSAAPTTAAQPGATTQPATPAPTTQPAPPAATPSANTAQTPPPAGGIASPADDTPAATTDAAGGVQTTAATPGNPAGAGVEDADIVVTGIRRSIQSAQAIKRNAPQVVDSIVAQDIGKLPDVAISDTAARIVGVQVERRGGEANRVLVRGLDLYTTTYNGREIFTAEARGVALQDFPAGGIAALDIFKTTTADLVEGGIAGEINVRSRRAFDFQGFHVAGAATALYTTEANRWKPNGNLLISNRWETGIGEIGALINVSYTRLEFLDSQRSNTDFIASSTDVTGRALRYPDIGRIEYFGGDRERPSANVSLQWKPMDRLELYADGLYQGFRNRISDRLLFVPLFNNSGVTNVELREGTDTPRSATFLSPQRPDGFQGGTFNKTDTYQWAVGARWEGDRLKASVDLARTDTTFTGSTASVDYATRGPYDVNYTFDVGRGDGGPEFAIPALDLTNPDSFVYRGFYEEAQQARSKDWQFRADVSYAVEQFGIDRIEAGFRFTDRDTHREFGNRYYGGDAVLSQNIPFSAVPLDYRLFRPGFGGSNIQPTLRTWLAPTYSSIRNNLVNLRQFSIDRGATNFTLDTVLPDPGQTYDASETTYAGYGQLRYAFGSDDGIRVDGVVGVRFVRTQFAIDGNTINFGGGFTPVSVRRSYDDWLPNVSARVRFTDQLQLRGSFTQTRTRPTYAQLNPSLTIGPPPTGGFRTANGGNPFLTPARSDNYDLSLEYYFTTAGFASVAVFRRDLNGFIQPAQGLLDDPNFGQLLVSTSFNTGRGRIDGIEGQLSAFLDLDGIPDWARGFGFQGNITYLDAGVDYPGATIDDPGTRRAIIGVSDLTFNLAGIYERGGVAARLSYNWRGPYTSTFRNDPGRAYTERTRPETRLDLSISYDVTPNITLAFDAVNLLREPVRVTQTTAFDDGGPVSYPRLVRYEESVYSFGVRFRL